MSRLCILTLAAACAFTSCVLLTNGCTGTPTDENRYSVQVSAAGGGTVSVSPGPGSDGLYAGGTAVTLTAKADAGSSCYFVEWEGDAAGASATTTIVVDSNKVVHAVFESSRCSVIVQTVGGGTVAVSPGPDPDGWYSRGTVVTLTAQPDPGTDYRFVRWEGDAGGAAQSTSLVVDGDKRVYAIFETPYSLSIHVVSGDGEVALSPPPGEDGKYEPGTVVTLTALPADGYRFAMWGRDASGTDPVTTVVMNDAKMVNVVFEAIVPRYRLTVNVQGQGTVVLDPPGGEYDRDTDVQLTANPAAGWTFTRWEGASISIVSPTWVKMTSDLTVTAVFTPIAPRYTLTVNVQGQGTVSVNPLQNLYLWGEQVTLDPNPAGGWRFDRWLGDLTGNADPATLTMDADKVVTAVFIQINQAPAANSQQVSTPQETPIGVTLTGSDPENNPLTYRVVAPPQHGQLNTAGQPRVIYTPDAGFTGTDAFSFVANDGTSDSPPAQVTIQVGSGSAFTFHAVYNWILDDDHAENGILAPRMSGDGQKIVFTNFAGSTGRKAWMVNADGSGLTGLNIPDGLGQLHWTAIDQDGSHAYVANSADRIIYRITGGQVTPISVAVNGGPDSVTDLQTTSDGQYLFFRDDRDVWRVRQDGAGLTEIIDDGAVATDAGAGYSVYDMAVSGDGQTVVFTLWGYWTPQTGVREKLEVFCWQNGTVRQLTTDGASLSKGQVVISGDGSTIIFATWAKVSGTPDGFFSIRPDGSNRIRLMQGTTSTGAAMTQDGSRMFMSGAGSSGRFVYSDGSGVFDLFPGWNVVAIALAATYDLSMSGDGTRVCFRHEYASWPFKRALVIGHFNNPGAVPGAPSVTSVSFSPSAMPRGDAGARVRMAARLADPNGLSNIQHVVADELVDGRLEGNSANLPAQFYFSPRDDGQAPDTVAGDGVYVTDGQPGGKINDYNAMTIRVGVQDRDHHVVVADVILPIGTPP